VAVAYLLAFPIALNQERTARSAGVRTFPLVAVGACGYMLIGRLSLTEQEALARIIYGIVGGIGFIGGGAILKGKSAVKGTSTAASIWNTGAIGVAVAWDNLEIAIILSLLNFFTLVVARPLKQWLREHDDENGHHQAVTIDDDSGK
jgi:putative Mg2+ transporter-C (MgtC) family protein